MAETKLKTNQAIQADAWTAFVPSTTNLTIGNGTLTGAYILIGKTVHYRIKLVFGSTTSITGNLAIGLPVTASASYPSHTPLGDGIILDAGAAYFYLKQFKDGNCMAYVTNATYSTVSGITSSVPMTWANTDELSIVGTYEAA